MHINDKRVIVLFWLFGIYTGLTVLAGPLAAKLFRIGGLICPAGVLAYSITFLISDVVVELYGKREGHRLVWVGLGALLISGLLIYIARLIPDIRPNVNTAFNAIFGTTLRIYIASIIAFLISQTHDVIAFSKWKKFTKGKYLWLRNNASTVVSQFLDTVIFITIAFYGVVPSIWPIIFGQYIIKLIIALLDTPFCYLAVGALKRSIFDKYAGT